MILIVLYIAAFILTLLAALGVGHPRFQLGWAGVACIALAMAVSAGGLVR
jgi:phage-related holin